MVLISLFKISFRLVPFLRPLLSYYKVHGANKAYDTRGNVHRREGFSMTLHGSRIHYGSKDFIRFVFSLIVLLKNSE